MNCKPGDLAILIRSRHPENIGRIIEVIEGSSRRDGHWLCRSRGAPLTATYRDGRRVESETGDALDADLRPVSGIPLEVEHHEEMAS